MAEFTKPQQGPQTQVPDYRPRPTYFPGNEGARDLGANIARAMANYKAGRDRIQTRQFENAFTDEMLDQANEIGISEIAGDPGAVYPNEVKRPGQGGAFEQGLGRLEALQRGVDQGVHDEQYRDSRIWSIAENLVMRYPDKRTEINQVMARITGRSLPQMIKDKADAVAGATDYWTKQQHEMADSLTGSGFRWGEEGRPTYDQFMALDMAEAQALVATHERAVAAVAAGKAELEFAQAEGKAIGEQQLRTFKKISHNVVRAAASAWLAGEGVTIEKLHRLVASGDVDAIQQIAGVLLATKSKMEMELRDMVYGGKSSMSMIDQDAVEKAIEISLRPYTLLQEMLTDEKLGALNLAGTLMEWSMSQDEAKALEGSRVLRAAALAKRMFGELGAQSLWFGPDGKAVEIMDAMNKLSLGNLMTASSGGSFDQDGDPIETPPGEAPATVNDAVKIRVEEDPKVLANLTTSFDKVMAGLEVSETSAKEVANMVSFFMSPQATQVMNSLSPSGKRKYLERMVGPNTVKNLMKLRDMGDTETYDMYTDFVGKTFDASFATWLADLQEFQIDRETTMITYNPALNQFNIATRAEFLQDAGRDPSARYGGSARTDALFFDLRDKVEELNKILPSVGKLLEDKEGDLTSVLDSMVRSRFSADIPPDENSMLEGGGAVQEALMVAAEVAAMNKKPKQEPEGGASVADTLSAYPPDEDPTPRFVGRNELGVNQSADGTELAEPEELDIIAQDPEGEVFTDPVAPGASAPIPRPRPDDAESVAVIDEPRRQIQLEFSLHELSTTETFAARAFKNAKTVEQGVAAGIHYLRPKGYVGKNTVMSNVHGYTNRLKNARDVLAGRAPPQAQEAFKWYVNRGWDKNAAAGMVGNMMQESYRDLQVDAWGDRNIGRGASGIAQWLSTRRTAMEAFEDTHPLNPAFKDIDVDAVTPVQDFIVEPIPGTVPEQVDADLLKMTDKGPNALAGIDPGYKSRIWAMVKSAPKDIQDNLTIVSGWRPPYPDTNVRTVVWGQWKFPIGDHSSGQTPQSKLFYNALLTYGSFQKARGKVAPPPGLIDPNGNLTPGSNHQLQAVDFGWRGRTFKDMPQGARDWLRKNGPKFGISFTKVAGEPWHGEPVETRGGTEADVNAAPKGYRAFLGAANKQGFADIDSSGMEKIILDDAEANSQSTQRSNYTKDGTRRQSANIEDRRIDSPDRGVVVQEAKDAAAQLVYQLQEDIASIFQANQTPEEIRAELSKLLLDR